MEVGSFLPLERGCQQSFKINDLEVVDQIFASWNQIAICLRHLDDLRSAA
jgi:hypothetical protein